MAFENDRTINMLGFNLRQRQLNGARDRRVYAAREMSLSVGLCPLWTIALTTPMKLPENAIGDLKNRGACSRGVVAAASYEAHKFGVRSAMPSITAMRRCPNLIFVKPLSDMYKEVSLQIRVIFAEYAPIIESLSLDEAYLDVTENLKKIASAQSDGHDARVRPSGRLMRNGLIGSRSHLPLDTVRMPFQTIRNRF